MNFCIIGTINRDHAIFSDGREVHGFGGIFYSILMLRHLIEKHDRIVPICNTGEDIYDEVLLKLTELGKVETRFMRKVAQKNTTVRLVYRDKENRDEFISHLPPPFSLKQLLQPQSIDAYLVNFITGREMSLPTFLRFCQKVDKPIFMDFHSLSLGIAKNGKRYYRYPRFWKKWISQIDVLQMNEKEAANLMRQVKLEEKDLLKFATSLINESLKIVNITLGSEGSILAYKKHGEVFAKKLPPFPIDEVVDVTGSGDAFMAGFLYHYMKTRHAEKAAEFANKVAALKCSKPGAEGIKEIASLAI